MRSLTLAFFSLSLLTAAPAFAAPGKQDPKADEDKGGAKASPKANPKAASKASKKAAKPAKTPSTKKGAAVTPKAEPKVGAVRAPKAVTRPTPKAGATPVAPKGEDAVVTGPKGAVGVKPGGPKNVNRPGVPAAGPLGDTPKGTYTRPRGAVPAAPSASGPLGDTPKGTYTRPHGVPPIAGDPPVVGGPVDVGPVTGGPAGVNGLGPRHTVIIHHVSPVSGIFVYGPRPGTSYDDGDDVAVAKKDLPTRELDRGGSLAVGLRGGAYASSTPSGEGIFGDPGAGLMARFRPVEFLGIEGGFEHAVGAAGLNPGQELRQHTLGTASAQIFAFPWSHVQPFASVGVTAQDSDFRIIGAADEENAKTLWGPHVGLGLELALGQSFAIDLDARYNHYLNAAKNEAVPAALTANLGMLFHF